VSICFLSAAVRFEVSFDVHIFLLSWDISMEILVEKGCKRFSAHFSWWNDECVGVKHVLECWICIGFSHHSFEFVASFFLQRIYMNFIPSFDYMLLPTLILFSPLEIYASFHISFDETLNLFLVGQRAI
jgi:hypothetical protein